MLRYRMIGVFLFSILFLSFCENVLAETLQGRIADASSSAIEMTAYDAQGRPYPNSLHLNVDHRTLLSGVSSVANLRPNDPVEVSVSQQESGVWRADSIHKFEELNAVPASPSKPSPSLAGALGNPVVRNALLGAATGAIASSASGGKAGKGALVGAGVGVAGGLLADMFSGQSSQPASSSSYQDDSRY